MDSDQEYAATCQFPGRMVMLTKFDPRWSTKPQSRGARPNLVVVLKVVPEINRPNSFR
jgi:hypothetical protein